jgi:hypothetical protein
MRILTLLRDTRNNTNRHRPTRVSPTANDAGNCFVALRAKRDQIANNFLTAKSFVCFVMHFEPPFRSVVEARLTLVSVDRQSLRPFFRPRLSVVDVHFVILT